MLAARLGEHAPAHLATGRDWIDRRAKLFEAGDYPDKGLTIAPEDLVRLQNSFDLPVPVLIEHAESPLELGYLTDVRAEGDELFGTLALTAEAHALVERSQARSLSLGISPDLGRIREVSIVSRPRVADARLFAGTVTFFCGVLEDGVDAAPAEPQESAERGVAVQGRDAPGTHGRDGHATPWGDGHATLQRLLDEGRIVPAQLDAARVLLGCTDTVQFGSERLPVAHVVMRLLEGQPPHRFFGEVARATPDEAARHLLLPEEAEFYRRYFPGISLDEIAQRKP